MNEGQVFKNYMELCEYMGEQTKTGASKISQLRRWSNLFTWHKKGHQIIIDEVFEGAEIVSPYDSHRDERVRLYMPYVQSHILGIDPDEYLGTQRLLGTTLRLIPMNAYRQINNRGMRPEDFYKRYRLEEPGSFEEYVSVAGILLKDIVLKCLKRMQKNKEIMFTEAEVFIVKDGRRRYLCVDGYDALVRMVETKVCNEMAAELHLKTKGRQLIHYIRGKKELMNRYYSRCIKELLKDPELVSELKHQYLILGPGRELNLDDICEYYKVIHIIDYDEEQIEKTRGPDYDEEAQLKKIYEDVKPRIAARVTSSKKDVAAIEKMLFG